MASEGSLPAWTHTGVLVYGPRKGGTTLLLNLHDGGSELVAYPSELKLKRMAREISRDGGDAVAKYCNASTILGRDFANFGKDGYRRFADDLREAPPSHLRELIRRDI